MCLGFALVAGSTFALGSSAVVAAHVQEGKEWRELYETTGLSWAAIATVCPTDGVTPCNGSVGGKNLTGWTWATAPQTLALMDDYYAGLANLNPPAVGGISGFGASVGFLGDMRWTGYMSLTYFYSEWAYGWTASQGASGLPIGGGAEFSHALTGSTASGSFGIGEAADRADSYTGAFLFRVAGLDYTPPTVTPTVTGTIGNSGWYRSDVGVSWTVVDAQSPIDSTTGCGPSTLALDTASIDYTCSATSFGGTGTGTVAIKRDNTPPTVACIGPAPTFDLGQAATISGSVSDATSGSVNATVSATAYTGSAGAGSVYLVGSDRARPMRTL